MIGIDVVEISRFRDMKNLEMFIHRVFTKNEAEYFATKTAAKNFYETVAGHYAAKEAFSKALGTGVRGFNLNNIEVCHDEMSMPYIRFGGARVNASLSISHSGTVAVAVVYIAENVPETGLPVYAGLDLYARLLPVRSDDCHKGDCGRVFVVGGSRGMIGAPCLAATGAMRTGSGLVTVGTPESQQPIAVVKLTEAMTVPLPETENGTLSLEALGMIKSGVSKSDVCVFGPGLSQNEDIPKLIDSLISGSTDFVIDADGLNAIAENMDILRKHKNRLSCNIVVTPHPGEMSRLCGTSVEAVENDRTGAAVEFAEEYGVVTVLKGKDTVIAAPDGRVHVNNSGNSAMATGGMGDVLSGVIGSFMGQGLDTYRAAVLGVFVHGVAGDLARKEIGDRGILASDLADRIPKAIRLVKNAE